MAGATVLAALLGLPVFLAAGYLAFLALASFARSESPSSSSPREESHSKAVPTLRFRLIVPAHNEEPGIARTVANLLALGYPPELRRLWVVADNCTDGTAAAAEDAGAEVIVRQDEVRRGKGYALELAFERAVAEGWADAVVVVDADTLVKSNLLSAFTDRFATGAEALQAHYGILAEGSSWRTRLLRLSFALFHGVRSAAREALGLSCGLRGNGMGFRVEVLKRVPHRAFSVVEDLEYGIDLGLAGVRVAYVGDTEVLGEMPSNEAGARTQRARWEGGRAQLRRRVPALLAQALKRRDKVLADLAIDLALPPLSTLCILAGLGSAAVVTAIALRWVLPAALAPWLFADAALFFYVLRGWAVSGVGARGLLDLAWAPVFIVWKLVRVGAGAKPSTWVRTARDRK